MNEKNDMMELANRSSQIIDSIVNAMMNTASVAADKINMASELASLKMRLESQSAYLGMVNAIKGPILEALSKEKEGSPMRLLLERQIETLTEQEMGILEKASVPKGVARQIIGKVDDRVYKRDGRRFLAVAGKNGDGASEVRDDEF